MLRVCNILTTYIFFFLIYWILQIVFVEMLTSLKQWFSWFSYETICSNFTVTPREFIRASSFLNLLSSDWFIPTQEGARIYAENAIRKKNESLNYLRMSSKVSQPLAGDLTFFGCTKTKTNIPNLVALNVSKIRSIYLMSILSIRF